MYSSVRATETETMGHVFCRHRALRNGGARHQPGSRTNVEGSATLSFVRRELHDPYDSMLQPCQGTPNSKNPLVRVLTFYPVPDLYRGVCLFTRGGSSGESSNGISRAFGD